MDNTAKHAILPNLGAMPDFIGPFDVQSKVTDYVYPCRFSHLWNAISTRHADTIDCKFFVEGRSVIVGLAHPGFVEFSRRRGRGLTDREASYLAAEYLRERLQQEDEHAFYDVAADDVVRLAEKLGFR